MAVKDMENIAMENMAVKDMENIAMENMAVKAMEAKATDMNTSTGRNMNPKTKDILPLLKTQVLPLPIVTLGLDPIFSSPFLPLPDLSWAASLLRRSASAVLKTAATSTDLPGRRTLITALNLRLRMPKNVKAYDIHIGYVHPF
eukprot:332298_1